MLLSSANCWIQRYGFFYNISDGDNTRPKKTQKKRADKIVSGNIKGTAFPTILSELGWESLRARRERGQIIVFAVIVHGNAPNWGSETFISKPFLWTELSSEVK